MSDNPAHWDRQALLRELRRYLPQARLQFQSLPECAGLELLLIAPGLETRSLEQWQIELLSDDPPYWVFCWASGRALARRVLAGEIPVRGRRVVDLGAGSGVVAIATSMAGAAEVYACDRDTRCLGASVINARHNGVAVIPVTELEQVAKPVDLILAADVLYESGNLPLLDLMCGYGCQVVLADSRLKSMPDPRFHLTQVYFASTFPDYAENREHNRVRVYHCRGS